MKFLGDKVELVEGDCRDAIKALPDNSIDAVVTDPPYALVSIAKRLGRSSLDSETDGHAKRARDGKEAYGRLAKGFMGKTWDTGEAAFAVEFWTEVYRVLKPGGYVASFSGTRTYHRMACAIEDAGFEIRDQLAWCYGSGFPKSHDVSKAIDKAAGAVRERGDVKGKSKVGGGDIATTGMVGGAYYDSVPATEAAAQWQGWGTALKPAWEPICLARKPLIGTVAENVLALGTGALNIDACRVEGEPWRAHSATGLAATKFFTEGDAAIIDKEPHSLGRWPANLLHDGSDEVLRAFRISRAEERLRKGLPTSSGTLTGSSKAALSKLASGRARGAPRAFSTRPRLTPPIALDSSIRP